MAAQKISDYLLNSKSHLSSKKNLKEASKISITSAKLTVLTKLGNCELIIPKTNQVNDLVEYNIIKHKLKGAKQAKEGLAQKVETIAYSIESLGNQLELQQTRKPKKKWNKELEEIKTEEIQHNVKRLIHERVERKKHFQAREKEKLEKFEIEEKMKQEENLKIEAKKQEDKKKQLMESKGKSEERKKYLEGIKELKSLKKKKLLHEKLEEEFEKKILIPETERISEAISLKHKIPVPSLEEIQSHIRDYKKLIQSKSVFRQSASYSESKHFSPSKFFQQISEEEELAKEMEKIKIAEKADLIDRKKNYSNLVRQLYKPLVSEQKPKEKSIPVKRRVLSLTPTLKKSERVNEKSRVSPKAQKPKELPKIDYLAERRDLRQKEAEDILDQYSFSYEVDSLAKAKKIEEKAKHAEYAFKGSKANDFNIEAEEKINKLLLESVKAKLEALHKLS